MMKSLLFEIGSEEIPARFIPRALENLKQVVTDGLNKAGLAYGEVQLFGTPRRLGIYMEIAEQSESTIEEMIGPPVRVAFDGEGNPTKAAESFASRAGQSVNKLVRVITGKGEYITARVAKIGKPAREFLPDILYKALFLDFPKCMHWGDVERTFARPVRWICALLGNEIIPVYYGNIVSGRTTRGHRFLAPEQIKINNASEYIELIEKSHVVANPEKRKALLGERVNDLAVSIGAKVRLDEGLLEEVTFLVESPHPILGGFPEDYLALPEEVLIQEMRKHQRYFSLIDIDGKLLPRFIAVSNTPVLVPEASVRGYERVLVARLADARFFFDEDRKLSLISRLPKLKDVVFHKRLGSLAYKEERIEKLSCTLAQAVGHEELAEIAMRAARLAKTDLTTLMVGEFPELQGIIGHYYALNDNEQESVAQAIEDHYMPRIAGDELPKSIAGAIVGLADRLDTLVALFAIGEPPTSTSDPFALRRACLGILHISIGFKFHFSLSRIMAEIEELLNPICSGQSGILHDEELQSSVQDFIRGRMKALWSESYPTDVVEAVLASGFDDIVATFERVKALDQLVHRSNFGSIGVIFKRVVNIVKKQQKLIVPGAYDPSLFKETAEHMLSQAITDIASKVNVFVKAGDFTDAFDVIASLEAPLAHFFETVLVMAEDPDLMINRIRLLLAVTALFKPLADFSKLTQRSEFDN